MVLVVSENPGFKKFLTQDMVNCRCLSIDGPPIYLWLTVDLKPVRECKQTEETLISELHIQ